MYSFLEKGESMKKEPIRILQCVSNMDRAGIETMIMNFYRNIDRTKVQFDFIVNKSKPGDYDEEILALGGKIYKSPGLNPLKFFKYQRFMRNLFSEHPEYKVIHCQNEAMGYYALKAANDCKIPVRISHSHNTTTRKDLKYPIKIFCKNQLKKVANVLVACSHAAGKYLFNEDVKVINNAIDTSKFIYNSEIRNKIRKKYNLQNKFVIGHVGRFEPQKNHEQLIRIFKEVNKINKDAILLLIGTGTLEEKIKEEIKNEKLEDYVIFTGGISNVNEFYQAMDVFVLPSFHEGLPVVGIEAQTSGLPCVFSNTITKEVKIINEVDFVGLDEDLDIWSETILKYKYLKRENKQKEMINAGYDIKESSKSIENWYIELHNAKVIK